MPEFCLDHGTFEASKQFEALDAFTQGYIEAMFFTNTGTGDDGELENATVADLDVSTWHAIKLICAKFQEDNQPDLDIAYDIGRIDGYDETRAGHDLWYTQNGHGVGYWDRDLGEVGDVLSDAARRTASHDLYLGDDGKIYF